MQDNLVIAIPEIDAIKGDIAFQGLIGGRILCLVIMLPRPLSCVLPGLMDLTVGAALAVDQHDIAVVRLRLGIHEIKDSLRACQCHDNAVELHTDLVDRHGKTPV